MRPALFVLPVIALFLVGCETTKRLTGSGSETGGATEVTAEPGEADTGNEAADAAVDAAAEPAREPGTLSPLAPTTAQARAQAQAAAGNQTEDKADETGNAAPEDAEEDEGKPLAVTADTQGCGAAERQDLVGKTTRDLTGYRYPAGTRFIGPNTAVTRDLRPDRLNIQFNRLSIVTRVWCG